MPVDKSDDRVKRMFGEIAPRYDLLNHLLSLQVDRYWRWRTVRLAAPEGSEPILDVCTGTGDLALAYWRRSRGKLPILATDFCAEMLRLGRQKRDRATACGILFVAADTQKLPFADNQFQLVTVAFGLRNVADTDAGLREMTRVCMPAGRLAILEFSLPRGVLLRTLYGWYFRRVLPRVGQCVMKNRWQAYSYLPQSVQEFPGGEALADKLRAAGCNDVRVLPLTLGTATLYIGKKTSPVSSQ